MNKFFKFNQNFELGEIFNECTAHQLAIEYLDKAIDISNNFPISKYRLVKAYELRGKSKMFLNDGKQKMKEEEWVIYWKAKKLNYLEAILDFSKAIEIDPTDDDIPTASLFRITGDCYFWRGFAYEFLEEYSNAIKDLKIAKQLNPKCGITKTLLDHIESKGFH